MIKILSQIKTYSHDNGLGVSHTYLYEYVSGSTIYSCVNGEVFQNNGKENLIDKENLIIGSAHNKNEFARIIEQKERGKE